MVSLVDSAPTLTAHGDRWQNVTTIPPEALPTGKHFHFQWHASPMMYAIVEMALFLYGDMNVITCD